MLAAWCQILLVIALARVPQAQAANDLDCVRMCQANADGDELPTPQKQDHSGHDCVLCVMCVAHATSAVLLASPPALPEQRFSGRVLLDAYRPRAPPVRPIFAAQPRGPPPLI